jgi:hypothetical protein
LKNNTKTGEPIFVLLASRKAGRFWAHQCFYRFSLVQHPGKSVYQDLLLAISLFFIDASFQNGC